MPAPRSVEELDKVIFPGGVPSRVAAGKAPSAPERIDTDGPAWDRHPQIKPIKGVDTELFQVGALARALGVQPVTIYKWERLKIIPPSRYRTVKPSKTIPGKTPAGRRLYTRKQIEVVIEAALHTYVSPRPAGTKPDWKQFTNLVVRGWRALG